MHLHASVSFAACATRLTRRRLGRARLLAVRSTVQQESMHTTADGRRFLVLHGDRCDLIAHVRTDMSYRVKNIVCAHPTVVCVVVGMP